MLKFMLSHINFRYSFSLIFDSWLNVKKDRLPVTLSLGGVSQHALEGVGCAEDLDRECVKRGRVVDGGVEGLGMWVWGVDGGV